MEWQERLRQVDARMASGEITPAEQRRLRDEILAEASGSGTSRITAGPRYQAPPPANPQQTPYAGGQEIFAVAAPSPQRTWIGALLVLLILVVAAGAMWWVVVRDGTSPAAAADTSLGVELLPNPVATPLSTVGEFSVADGLEHGLLQESDTQLFQDAGVGAVAFRTVADGPLSYQLFLFETGTQDGAARLRSGIISSGEGGGMVDAEVDGLPSGVTVTKASDPKVSLMQSVYATEGGVVRIVILQSGRPDSNRLETALAGTVALAVEKLPVHEG